MLRSNIKDLAAEIHGSLKAIAARQQVDVLYLRWEIFVAAVSRAEAACEPLVEPVSQHTHRTFVLLKCWRVAASSTAEVTNKGNKLHKIEQYMSVQYSVTHDTGLRRLVPHSNFLLTPLGPWSWVEQPRPNSGKTHGPSSDDRHSPLSACFRCQKSCHGRQSIMDMGTRPHKVWAGGDANDYLCFLQK